MKLPFGMSESALAGAGIYLLAVLVLVMIWLRPELAQDDLFKTLAQAIIVQGLIGLAMASWFTKSKPHQNDPPQQVEVVNQPEQPVPVEPNP